VANEWGEAVNTGVWTDVTTEWQLGKASAEAEAADTFFGSTKVV
jgi:hypothetical protein